MNQESTSDRANIEQRTLAWVEGWRTSPEAPFALESVEALYARDETFSSFDFARPHDGFSDWATAARYYRKFMALPETWRLEAGNDLRVQQRGTVAWSTVSLKGRGTLADGTVIDMPEARVTLIFEKRDGEWLIVHEHGSSALPFPDEAGLKAILPA